MRTCYLLWWSHCVSHLAMRPANTLQRLDFQENLHCTDDNWDAHFGECMLACAEAACNALDHWSLKDSRCKGAAVSSSCACAAENWKSADMVDCILCFAATELVDKMTSPNDPDGRAMLERVNAVRVCGDAAL
jgi:hypothetical protein